MKNLVRSLAAGAVTAVAAGSLVIGFSGAAFAAGNPPWEPIANPPEVGGLLFFNSAGQQITGGNLTDSPIAAYVEGTATVRAGDTKATLYGYLPVNGQAPGAWSGEALGSSTVYPNASAPAPLNTATLPVETGAAGDESIATLESDLPNTDTSSDGYAGIYVLRLETNHAGGSQTTSYDSADIQITGSTWSVVYPALSLTSTTTTLTSTPASTAVSGTSVTLNAAVSPSAPGTVQFEYGTTDIGAPVTVTGGTASISTSSLPVGTDSLSAVFTPAQFSDYSGSTGTESFSVTPPPATGTTTALAVNPATGPADSAVAITASVTNNTTSNPLTPADGSVQFYDNGTVASGLITGSSVSLGTVPLATGGTATLNYSLFAQGAHNLVAVFEPTTPAVYNTSTSSNVLFTATAPTYTPDNQTVTVGIPAGTLTITTPYTPTAPFQLGTATLNSSGTEFQASAPFGNAAFPQNGVTITDTGIGNQPWTASVAGTDFTSGANTINGQNLTFTGVTPSYLSGNAYSATGIVVGTESITDTLPGGLPYAAGATGSDGVKGGPHAFAQTTTPGAGSVYVYGNLNLVAPTSAPAGTYTATLTFTIV